MESRGGTGGVPAQAPPQKKKKTLAPMVGIWRKVVPLLCSDPVDGLWVEVVHHDP